MIEINSQEVRAADSEEEPIVEVTELTSDLIPESMSETDNPSHSDSDSAERSGQSKGKQPLDPNKVRGQIMVLGNTLYHQVSFLYIYICIYILYLLLKNN